MLAQATPAGDRFQPSGVEIVQRYAENLLEIGNLTETVRGPKPAVIAPPTKTWRYLIGEKLGEGGMAEVFRGTMTGAEGFARPVAIKRILPELSTLPRFAQMFVQEAQIVSQLAHPNVVSVLDFDHDPDGRLILVLEFVEGLDLHRLMASGPIPHSVVIFVVTELLSALGYAHNLPAGGNVRGIVHRDVSPHNVLLSWEGGVKLADFGLAKPREASEASASVQLKGKAAYMSPEQINGNALDGRSDLFAVGIILHEMLTRERLFWKDDLQTTIYRVLDRPIPKPSLKVPVAPDLEAVVMRLLERDLASRYATAEQAGEALAGCVDASLRSRSELVRLLAERFPQSSRASRPPSPGGRAEASAPPSDRDRASSSRSRTRPLAPPSQATSLSLAASESMQSSQHAPRHRRLLAGVAITVIASGASGVFVGVRRRHEPPIESAAVAPTPLDGTQSPRAAAAVVPALPTDASGLTAPPDATLPTNTSGVTSGVTAPPNASVPDAGGRDAAVPDVLPIPDATPPVTVVPAASPSTRPIVRPRATTPAKVTKPPQAVPTRRPGKADSDDVGGD